MNRVAFVHQIVLLFLALHRFLFHSVDACNSAEDHWLHTGPNSFPPYTQRVWLDLPGGIRTHYLRMQQDDKPALVMLHGTGSAASLAWGSIAGKLATDYSIYAPDLPAFGRSQLPRSSFETATHAEVECVYADWLAHFIDALHVTPVVVAHSMGAFFAIKFAKKYPTKLSKLILVDPAGLLPTLGRWGLYFAWVFKLGIPTKQIRGLGLAPLAALLGSATGYWLRVHASPTAFGDRVVAKFITVDRGTGFWNRPALGDLLTAGVPVAFIYGETDSLLPPAQGRVVVEVAMRDGAVEDLVGLVPGAWHTPFHVRQGAPFVDKLLRAVEVARVPAPSPDLVRRLDAFDPSLFASSWSLEATTACIERLYAHLRELSLKSTI